MSEPYQSIASRQSLSLLVCVFLAASLHPADLQGQRNRDSWQRVPDVMAALAIGEGSYVADIGAGDGYFTEYLADEVGAVGRVFAVDISEEALSNLRRLVENEGLENVEVVSGDIDDPRLAEQSVDAVLVVNAYHEMTEHEAMLAGMLAALKPGGRLVMLDHTPSDPSESRREQTRDHDLSIDIVERELQAAGFEILERHEDFAGRSRSRQWMLVARR
jgi:predicted methyltransferase